MSNFFFKEINDVAKAKSILRWLQAKSSNTTCFKN